MTSNAILKGWECTRYVGTPTWGKVGCRYEVEQLGAQQFVISDFGRTLTDSKNREIKFRTLHNAISGAEKRQFEDTKRRAEMTAIQRAVALLPTS